MQMLLTKQKLFYYSTIFWMLFLSSRHVFTFERVTPPVAKLSLAPMIEQVTPSVVNISSQGEVQLRFSPLLNDPFSEDFFNFPNQTQKRRTQSLGSGVIVDANEV